MTLSVLFLKNIAPPRNALLLMNVELILQLETEALIKIAPPEPEALLLIKLQLSTIAKEAKQAAGPSIPFAFIILIFLRVMFDPVKVNILA